MSWESSDGTHEGYVVTEFADGLRGTGVSGGQTPADHVVIEVIYEDDVAGGIPTMKVKSRPAAEVIGWRIVCDCREDAGSSRVTGQWVSDLITRVPLPALADIDAGRLHALDEGVIYVEDVVENFDSFVARWRREHAAGRGALAAITAALDSVALAESDLDAAVAAARAAGHAWEAIGTAAGMAPQSALQRWG